MSSTPIPKKNTLALDFKSAALYAVRVVLHSHQLDELLGALDKRMHDAGSFFENEPVVIDASGLTEQVDWKGLVAALRKHALHPIGVVADGVNLEGALALGLAQVDLSSAPTRPAAVPAQDKDMPVVAPPPEVGKPVTGEAAAPGKAGANGSPAHNDAEAPSEAQASPAPPAVAPAAMVVNRQLRSGQRVYARDTDLIVIGVVSQGAEVIADGNIHIYGPLRGKAMAGARGDTSARIFTTQLDPELIAIAGVYRVIETRLDDSVHNKPAIIQLSGDSLQISELGHKG